MTRAIVGVNVVDPTQRVIRPDRALLVDGDRFAGEISMSQTPVGAELIDATGYFAMPGLIDAHIHLRATPHVGPTDANPTPGIVSANSHELSQAQFLTRLHSFLYCGITSFFDAGNDRATIFGLREAERGGAIVSPRIFATGNLFSPPGGHGCSVGVEVAPDADIPALVAKHAEYGPDVVKITYDEHGWGVRPMVGYFSPETLQRLISEIHRTGRKVTVHVSNEIRAREALAAGADILAHPVIQSPMNDDFAAQIAQRGVPVVSTLTIGDRYARLADDPDFLDLPLYRDCEWPTERHRLKTEEAAVQRGNRWADWMRTMTPIAQENLRMLAAAGAIVATGTDQTFGPDFHRELELLSGAGLSMWDVLRAATCHAAVAVDRVGEIGVIAPGAYADLVLSREDPTAALRALTGDIRVIKGGTEINRASLDLPVNASEPGGVLR